MSSDHYAPKWDGSIGGWATNHVAANLWRVRRTHDFDDLLQEAQLVFLRCAKRYPELDAPQHFMALFQRALTNKVHDLANAATKMSAEVPEPTAPGGAPWEGAGELECDGELAVKLRQAPSEITQVLALFLNAPQELLDMALASWKSQDRRRTDGGSKQVNRCLGLPEGRDVMQEVRDYFS